MHSFTCILQSQDIAIEILTVQFFNYVMDIVQQIKHQQFPKSNLILLQTGSKNHNQLQYTEQAFIDTSAISQNHKFLPQASLLGWKMISKS